MELPGTLGESRRVPAFDVLCVANRTHSDFCWPAMQGMKDTQILHTTSDVSSDSPSHAKVEEQSSFKVYSEKMLLRGGSRQHFGAALTSWFVLL